jgi:predicted nucleic acid-binding protein
MPPPAEPTSLAVDACVLLNLAGAGIDLADIARALDLGLVVIEQVAAEVLWIEDVVDGEPVRVPVDLTDQVGRAGVEWASLENQALEAFVALAAELDDGEAATLAAAQSRRIGVLTDDRKARRVARRMGVAVVGTAELLRQFAERQAMTDVEVGELLRRVERRARFTPRRDDPERAWWSRHVEHS